MEEGQDPGNDERNVSQAVPAWRCDVGKSNQREIAARFFAGFAGITRKSTNTHVDMAPVEGGNDE